MSEGRARCQRGEGGSGGNRATRAPYPQISKICEEVIDEEVNVKHFECPITESRYMRSQLLCGQYPVRSGVL
ncbi:hypothetical protein EYF80_029892 [Liparis tanakae]|uniref:Uncharacterized protein n=1 Tax=Liparis tanakae TaxID=230148 RepID=A0A4Z2H2A9_9TELE|nr:hypothetical protein EYF80_029892 [Liparis tanakae]